MSMLAPRLQHRYEPRGGCLQLMEARHDEVLVSGPAGTGKSRGCLEKMHLLALLNPEFKGLIVRKTQVSMTSTALVTYRQHVAPEAVANRTVRWFGGSGQKPAAYQYSNGSELVVGGVDKPTKIMSSEYDCIYVQEAIELTEDDWESLTTRLRNGKVSFQQLLADTNPSTPTHWLKQRCNEGRTHIIESRHEDNPTLVNVDGSYTERGGRYMSILDALTGPRKARLRHGLWVAAEGAIFSDWDEAVHLVDRFPVPHDWPRYWTIDFGYTNPFVLQCWAQDPDGRIVMYREIYMTQRLVADHAATMRRIVCPDGKWLEPQPRWIVADHDAEGRATFEREMGISTTAADKRVTEGLQAVQVRLRRAGDGKPRLRIMRDSLVERDQSLADAKKPCCTAEEIPGYVWADTAKEQPLKEDDHGCDGMRYQVVELDHGIQPRVRFM